jgi:UDP-glucose 4-epimerase
LDPAALDEAFAGCEVVFHEAAIASVARSLAEPGLSNDVNATGTIEVMLAAARRGVRRVVFAGSSAVYGVSEESPSHEGQRASPRSPYGVSKLAAEHYVHTLGELHGVETVALRYFNVYGPGQDPASEYAAVVPRFITAVLKGQRPTINGDGAISRDFVYVDDVVEANLLASLRSSPSTLTCNVAAGSQCSLLELLKTICDVAGIQVPPVFAPPRQGDIRHSQADISLARQALGYRASVALGDGISRILREVSAEGEVDVLREGVRLLAQAIMEAGVSELTRLPRVERDPAFPSELSPRPADLAVQLLAAGGSHGGTARSVSMAANLDS